MKSFKKTTKDNFRQFFEEWKEGKNRDHILVFHISFLNMSTLETVAFDMGFSIDIVDHGHSTLLKECTFNTSIN